MPEERLQKILAQAGYGSRRSAEELISAGRVRVNGQVAILGTKADVTRDSISVDGKLLPKAENKKVYIALHKPRGVLSDSDPNDTRPTVLDMVPDVGHLFAVGRLDLDSEGLMLLTNDGELAHQLTHPRYGHEKEYKIIVARRPDVDQLAALQHGVVLEDGHRTAPANVTVEGPAGKGVWVRIILREGRKRQIREMGKRIGMPVMRILRVRIGSLELGDLKPGQWRHLTPAEVEGLKGGVIKTDPRRSKAKIIPGKTRSRPPTQNRPAKSGRSGPPRGSSGSDKRKS